MSATISTVNISNYSVSQEEIYFIEESVIFNSWFSGASWCEGHIIFVKGRENVPDAQKVAILSDETISRSFQIRGESKHIYRLGKFIGISNFKDISKSDKVDIIYNQETKPNSYDYDKPIDRISSCLIIGGLHADIKVSYYDPESNSLKNFDLTLIPMRKFL